MSIRSITTLVRAALAAAAFAATPAAANPLFLFELFTQPAPQPSTSQPYQPVAVTPAARPLTPESATEPEASAPQQARFRRQVVDYPTSEAPGTIIVDTPNTYLYFVLGGSKAIRYGIGVGRDGFTWSGVHHITRKSEWPDWTPPPEMVARQPYLPRFMSGGPQNPLGARAMYLGETIYRIHGTNAPDTIGGHVSSGCFRMVNDDVIDLYNRVKVGTKVIVLPDSRAADKKQRAASLRVSAAN
jgi:lipoprotein-anchoring transpeptidase ErfK/SrfK